MGLNDQVVLPGTDSDRYWDVYDASTDLEASFPGQCAYDLLTGSAYNDRGPLVDGAAIAGLLMLAEGENDGADWVWLVTLGDGTTWWAAGGCDYTGWDCQSWFGWEPFDASAV